MHLRSTILFVPAALFVLGAAAAPAFGDLGNAPEAKRPPLSAGEVAFFEKSIRPVLVEKCYKCHSATAEKLKGGLLLDTREGIRVGGDSGAAVVPGDLKGSLLIKALQYADKDLAMPPEKSGGKLSDSTIKDFEKWVAMGAPDPRESSGSAAGAVAQAIRTPGKQIDWQKAREHWAFQAPKMPAIPQPRDAAWARRAEDRFILAQLEARGLRPVRDAEPAALLRRLSFDLAGLPPTPAELAAYLRECASGRQQQATEAAVDRLLGAPQFGERWGRHWLDVARFGESTGKERNYTFPTAWRYRDYVIGAVNADKPYDRFIREQLAGDLLPSNDPAEHDEHLVATAFLAVGPKGLNEKNKQQFAMDLVDDQIDTMSRAVLGLTVACARCHDHKFDPIPTKDYYALAGIFRSTSTFYGTPAGKNKNPSTLLALAPGAPPSAPLALVAPVAPAPLPPAPAPDAAAVLLDNPARAAKYARLSPPQQAAMLQRLAGGGKGNKGDKKARKQRETAAAPPTIASGALPDAETMGVMDGRVADSPLLVRGEVDHRGETVPRGVLTVLATGAPLAMPANASGRAQLADWLTAPENPLTARVMVNRVWLHLFGQGLVRTADNFGAMGARPSHPELLDFLAVKFMQEGWSMKQLIRELVLSRTYQLSTAHDAEGYAADPDNNLLWRSSPRRLEGEAIRDAMLAASGQLDRAPLEGSVVAQVGDGYIGKGIKTTAFQTESNKRSVYLPIVRDLVPDVLEVFDFAEPSLVVAGRDVTNVPAQALFLMNNGFALAQAKAMAQRILAAPLDYPQRIALAYELALSRAPTAAERERADHYLRAEGRQLIPVKGGQIPAAAASSWATFCQALFACAEFRYLL